MLREAGFLQPLCARRNDAHANIFFLLSVCNRLPAPQVGPPTLLALAELLVANVVAFDSGSANANPWLARLVKTRVIVLLPVSNAIGYETINRLELGVDPNRDFPYSRAASQCMVTAVARSINEVWKEHLFQLSVTFHGGMQAIAYEWGAPNHLANDSESPDDTAQARICHSLSDYAGRFQGDTYPYGRLNKLVYWVDGGMEDWGYAAGWDLDAVT